MAGGNKLREHSTTQEGVEDADGAVPSMCCVMTSRSSVNVFITLTRPRVNTQSGVLHLCMTPCYQQGLPLALGKDQQRLLGEAGEGEEECPVEELLSFLNSEGDSCVLHAFILCSPLTSKTDSGAAERWLNTIQKHVFRMSSRRQRPCSWAFFAIFWKEYNLSS